MGALDIFKKVVEIANDRAEQLGKERNTAIQRASKRSSENLLRTARSTSVWTSSMDKAASKVELIKRHPDKFKKK